MFRQVIDLSHTLHNEMPVYPGTPEAEISKCRTIKRDGFAESYLKISTHVGTHIDLPFHLLSEGKSSENMPADHFIGTALQIHCQKSAIIDVDVIQNILKDLTIPDFILFSTGWVKYWGQQKYFHNYPVLSDKAIRFLCSVPVKGLGIDAISFDDDSGNLTNHKALLKNDIILVENLNNMVSLPDSEFIFSCFPLKIKEGDGSPIRAVALIP